MKVGEVIDMLRSQFPDVVLKKAWGETSFFVNPENILPSGAYFATIKEKDGENDSASNLDRDGIFRLNFGPGKPAFVKLFGSPPVRPGKGGIIEGPWQFDAMDKIMPHPVYGWMSWMCVLNPSNTSIETCMPLLKLAYDKASVNAAKRIAARKG